MTQELEKQSTLTEPEMKEMIKLEDEDVKTAIINMFAQWHNRKPEHNETRNHIQKELNGTSRGEKYTIWNKNITR